MDIYGTELLKVNDYFKDFKQNLEFHFSEVLEQPFSKPRWIYISLSHDCTYKCRMCGVVKILKGLELPKELVLKALDEISQWQSDSVIMFTGGEPFLRKDIFDLIDYSVKKSLKTEVVSNGSLIDGKLSEKIIASGLQNIAISLDGVTEVTHDFIREKNAFIKATKAIKNLVQAKKKLGKNTQISAWTTIMKENIKELSDIIYLANDLGVECLVYHPVIVAQDDMQNTSPDAPFWIRENDLEILKDQIDKIVEYKNKYGLVPFLHDPYLWINYFESSLNKDKWKCNPFVFINIGPDGEVRSCGSAFGNLKEMNLEQCLDTKDAFQARRLMKNCKKPCLQTCWAHPESDDLTKIAEVFINNIKAQVNKKRLLHSALKILKNYEEVLLNYNND
jgi:MoaA/NifB/PqqE/SkfB family radical SAM enzyme